MLAPTWFSTILIRDSSIITSELLPYIGITFQPLFFVNLSPFNVNANIRGKPKNNTSTYLINTIGPNKTVNHKINIMLNTARIIFLFLYMLYHMHINIAHAIIPS